jgi:hypothetical protein
VLSLSKIITILEDLQTGSSQLSSGSFYFGDPWEFGASNRIQYPFVGCRLISSNINGKIMTTSLNLFFCDLVHKDESNESQVLSDMTRASYRFYAELKKELEDNYTATINATSSITPFTERFDDEVSGVEVNINIEQFYDRSTCE